MTEELKRVVRLWSLAFSQEAQPLEQAIKARTIDPTALQSYRTKITVEALYGRTFKLREVRGSK